MSVTSAACAQILGITITYNIVRITVLHDTVVTWSARWSDSKNNDIELCALNSIKLNYALTLACSYVCELNSNPTDVYSMWNYLADSLRPHKYLCNIYDRLMRANRVRIDTLVPPKAIRALYFRHFLRPTLAGIMFPPRSEGSPSISAANIPLAITRIMSTDFSL